VLAGGIAGATLMSIGFVPAAYVLTRRIATRRRSEPNAPGLATAH